MKTLEVASDPYTWAEVPLSYPCGPFETQAQWADALADAFSPEPSESQKSGGDRARLVEVARALPVEPRAGLFKLYWLSPDPVKQPLLLNVNAVSDNGEEPTPLQELAGAYDSDPIRPPIVDQVETAHFGTVARVLSYVKDEERGRLVMQISLVGWADGVLVRLDAFTADLPYGIVAVDPITELMSAIRVADATGETETVAQA